MSRAVLLRTSKLAILPSFIDISFLGSPSGEMLPGRSSMQEEITEADVARRAARGQFLWPWAAALLP